MALLTNQQFIGVAVVGVAAAWWLKRTVTKKLDVTSRENIVYKTVAGEDGTIRSMDYAFAALDLINPFNESDTYARQLYGLEVKQ